MLTRLKSTGFLEVLVRNTPKLSLYSIFGHLKIPKNIYKLFFDFSENRCIPTLNYKVDELL